MASADRGSAPLMGRFALVAWTIALLVAATEPRPWSLHTKLTVLGAALEASGIVLLAADLLFRPAALAWRQGRQAAAGAVAALARRLRRHQEEIALSASAGSVTLSGDAAEVHITPASKGERLDEMQREISELRNRIADVETTATREITKVRSELERRAEELQVKIASAIEEARGEYFIWRACGFLIALAGSVVLALSNLL